MSKSEKVKVVNQGSGGAFYFFGGIGALVYYLQLADGFTEVVVAILKSIVWPAFVIYDLMKFLDA